MSFLFDGMLPGSTGPLGAFGPVVEIALMAGVFYGLLGVIRGTRGAGVARGLMAFALLMLLAFMVLVNLLRLDNLAWLMHQLVAVLGIGVIVLFQAEIRQALVRLGGTFRMFTRTGPSVDKEIADAATVIGKSKDGGALIVLERETPLGGYIDSGVPVDAALTAPMLRTIFTKNTPLHDGAVIVRAGRIVAANCLLPLSENVDMCRGMGTRHRAAIGLSEETDAVTVVVSEETGAMSTTMYGRIYRDLDYEQLRAFLREHMGAEAARARDTAAAEARGGEA